MGSQDTHHLPCTPRPAGEKSDIDRWLEKLKGVVSEMPQPAFVDGTLHDMSRLRAVSVSLASRLDEISLERNRRRQLADR